MAVVFDGIIPTKSNFTNYIVQEHVMRYVFASNYVKNKIVLDVACGAGYGSHFLAIKGAKKVYGVDIDENALKIAKTYYVHPNVEYIKGDVLKLPFPNNFFDIVVSFETIEHISDTEKYITEIKRVLKPRSIFICSTPNIKYTKHPKYHVHEFYPKEFWELVERNFKGVERYGQYISYFQRLNDMIMLKPRIFNIVSRVLSLSPYGDTIKENIQKVLYDDVKQDTLIKPLKINEMDVSMFSKNKVVPIEASKGLLRIMVAVCEI
jgi:ubiquinone/menaquinone biosynthesis C-methylase UbiE